MPRTKAEGPQTPPPKPPPGDEARRQRLRELRQELLAYYPGPVPRSRLVLMDVDPATLHVYWSVDPDLLSGLRRRHRTPAAPVVLRLYDLNGTPGGSTAIDTPLEGLTNNRYVEVGGEGRTYLGQIGLKTRRRFISLTTSRPVRMPGPAPEPPEAASVAESPQPAASAPEATQPAAPAPEAAQPGVASPGPAPARSAPSGPAGPAESSTAEQRAARLSAEMDKIVRNRYRELVRRAEQEAERTTGAAAAPRAGAAREPGAADAAGPAPRRPPGWAPRRLAGASLEYHLHRRGRG